uniref:MRN complex-interacting protein N-terminal domain-containing protein n=1 Tax=Heliothis virescens TaxID=7102 RepID=A0A2A4K4J4_HELVI
MPQIFQVLRCYKCSVFQVHQTKKSNKWECKLCGEKQSIKRHYGLGTAKDCRLHVQKLNGMRGEIDGLKDKLNNSDTSENEENNIEPINNHYSPIKNSKWANYVEETETVQNTDEKMSLVDAEVVLEIPQKRRKRFQNIPKKYPKTATLDHVDIQETYEDQSSTIVLSEPRPIANINTVRCEQKPSQPSSHSMPDTEIENVKTMNHSKKIFVPPIVNKNSKWAQFTDDADQTDQSDIAPSQSIETSQNNVLFFLSDDTDLDNILNI